MIVGKSDLPLDQAIRLAKINPRRSKVVFLESKHKTEIKLKYLTTSIFPELKNLVLKHNVMLIITTSDD